MRRLSLFAATVAGGVWRLFAVTALLLGLLVGALYWNLQAAREAASDVAHTQAVERELQALGEELINAETGQRGYLLTGQQDYLEPYTAGVASIGDHFARVKALAQSGEVQDALQKLEPLIATRLAIMAETVELARRGDWAGARDLVKQGHGKRVMDEFRQLRAAAIEHEAQLLTERRKAFVRQLNRLLLVVGGGALLALVLLAISAARTVNRLKRPVMALLKGIAAMSEGDLEQHVEVASRDEIGRVAEAFNDMAARVLAAHQAKEESQRDLERSNAELDNFAYVASHDLKAPLRGIRNLAEWIKEDIDNPSADDRRENLRLLQTRVDRLDGLLESLLAYSRVGRKHSAAERLDTGRLVAEIGDYLAPRAGFQVACSGDMPVIFTPRAPLEQVFVNLLGNALKHHDREAGGVTVSARDLGERVEFRVSDDGPGIRPEFHGRVFQMFQTLRPRDEVEGSGMGLAIVKKTVESFGGTIRLESAPPERGTAFIFDWPKSGAA